MPVSYKSIKKPSKRGYFCVYFLLFTNICYFEEVFYISHRGRSWIIVFWKDGSVICRTLFFVDSVKLWLCCVVSWEFWTRLICLGSFQSIPAKTHTTLWIIVLDSSHCDFISILTVTVTCSCILLYEYELWPCASLTSYCNVSIWIRCCLIEENYISLFRYSSSRICYSFPFCSDERWAS